MAEGARLESVFRGNSNVGSNPTLSASTNHFNNIDYYDTVGDTENGRYGIIHEPRNQSDETSQNLCGPSLLSRGAISERAY